LNSKDIERKKHKAKRLTVGRWRKREEGRVYVREGLSYLWITTTVVLESLRKNLWSVIFL
jgi:hypothetical protein